jgi:hypothetical protein
MKTFHRNAIEAFDDAIESGQLLNYENAGCRHVDHFMYMHSYMMSTSKRIDVFKDISTRNYIEVNS